MTATDRGASLPPEQLDALVTVLDMVRSGEACTRPELGRRSGLGRTVVTQRVGHLIDSGLVEEGSLGPSTGGRAPRQLRFRAEAGAVLVAELGATSIGVGITDLAGRLLHHSERPWDIAAGPEASLEQVEASFDELRAKPDIPKVWGIGIGVPGPVEMATGRPVAPPIMPGWDRYPVRDRLGAQYGVPVCVDNEVNAMALGEYRAGLGQGLRDLIYLKLGTGIGAGLISGGRPHRGAQGCAGDVGHVAVVDDTDVVCRCGNVGCLEALAGGAALARDATTAATGGQSPLLAERLAAQGHLKAEDVARAAEYGDPVSVELLTRSGRLVGTMLATLVNFYNPSLVVIGGGVAASGDLLLSAIRQAVYRRSLPLATRNLRIARSPLDDRAGLMGAGFMVVDELFSTARIGTWIADGSPAGRPELTA
ncbi:ROK family protein [Pseudonocardia sp.]|uniref:ROK family protein n=1 Tax=Pseudonocardia sp. TaxID=60912 RepID=UPI00262FA8E5|nr:ROK family protein [Pseudonocardia sp.]